MHHGFVRLFREIDPSKQNIHLLFALHPFILVYLIKLK